MSDASVRSPRPAANDREGWKAYWREQGMPWRTEPEIDPKRQAELAGRRQIVANAEIGEYPFKGMSLIRADVEWLLATHESEGLIGPVLVDDESHRLRTGLDLRAADLSKKLDLRGLPFARTLFGTPMTAESLSPTEKRPPMWPVLYAIFLLLATECLIAVPAPWITFISVDPFFYFLGVMWASMILAGVAWLLGKWIRPLRAWYLATSYVHTKMTLYTFVMLGGALFAIGMLSLQKDDHIYAIGCGVVVFVITAGLGPYLFYLAWRGRALRARELRVLLIQRSGANLASCNLAGVHLERAVFGGANLTAANLNGAYLAGASLDLAQCNGADLRGIDFSLETSFKRTILGQDSQTPWTGSAPRGPAYKAARTALVVSIVVGIGVGAWLGPRLLDGIIWGMLMGALAGFYVGLGVGFLIGLRLARVTRFATSIGGIDWSLIDVSQLNWDDVTKFGDEHWAESSDDLSMYEVIKLYRGLAHRLREDGFLASADRLTYRSLVVQRQIRLRESGIPSFVGSFLLDALAGYGFKPMRTLGVYIVTVLGFAAAYFYLTPPPGVAFSPWAALFLSMASFHGRGFFPGTNDATHLLAPDAPMVALAAAEALFGLFVEISLIATFTQRFFGGK
jgi:uncharacterized protein YjbI with pentapeptide repeats